MINTYQLKEFIDEHISISDGKSVEFLGVIVNHSKNIKDLLEPGDLVRIFVEENIDENGVSTEDTCIYEVSAIQVQDSNGNELDEIGIVGENGTELIPFANVRGIVTKEQFASVEYVF